jgi:hypothetical protein
MASSCSHIIIWIDIPQRGERAPSERARFYGSGEGKGLTPLFCILLLNLLCMSRRTFNFLRMLDDSSRVEITYTQCACCSLACDIKLILFAHASTPYTQLPVRVALLLRQRGSAELWSMAQKLSLLRQTVKCGSGDAKPFERHKDGRFMWITTLFLFGK